MTDVWEALYSLALDAAKPREISKSMYVGSVGAAVLTKDKNIYTGICIDTASSLGMCAERNALSTMLAQGETEAVMIVSVYHDGKVMPPCGACREFMMQLGPKAGDIQVLLDNQGTCARLEELMPCYPDSK